MPQEMLLSMLTTNNSVISNVTGQATSVGIIIQTTCTLVNNYQLEKGLTLTGGCRVQVPQLHASSAYCIPPLSHSSLPRWLSDSHHHSHLYNTLTTPSHLLFHVVNLQASHTHTHTHTHTSNHSLLKRIKHNEPRICTHIHTHPAPESVSPPSLPPSLCVLCLWESIRRQQPLSLMPQLLTHLYKLTHTPATPQWSWNKRCVQEEIATQSWRQWNTVHSNKMGTTAITHSHCKPWSCLESHELSFWPVLECD